MAVEIEKKFLVKGTSWKENATAEEFIQGYICSGDGATVRVRIAGEKSYITIKGKSSGISKLEYEYDIPMEDAEVLVNEVCRQPVIHKTRYRYEFNGFVWEIDEFHGNNSGLIIAEIELDSEDQDFAEPGWLGKEVSLTARYYNASLAVYPYSQWTEEEKMG